MPIRQVVTMTGLVFLLTALTGAFVEAELVAEWHFDEGTGDTAIDSSGNGADGSIVGAKYVPGAFGTALEFDGDDYVEIGLLDAFQTGGEKALTVEVWVKLSRTPDALGYIFQSGVPAAVLGFTMTNSNGGLFAWTGSSRIAPDPDMLPLDEWAHVAITYDGETQQRFYVNGEELASLEIADNTEWNGAPWVIGADTAKDKSFLTDGTLDEMRIWNEVLPAEELGFFMDAGRAAVEPSGKLATTWAELKK